MPKFPKFEYTINASSLQILKTALYKSILLGRKGIESREIEFAEQTVAEMETVGVSVLGTPVYDNLTIDTDGENLRIDTVLITVSQTKNIVKTAIQGLAGTVKEYISDGDYIIKINGIIAGEGLEYPTDDVNTLIEILKRAEKVRVTSKFLQLFGIDDIVIESYEMKQDEFINMQSFEITAVSDKPIELLLNKNL